MDSAYLIIFLFFSTFDKSCQLLDLGKYLQQQAELAKQRKELKKRKNLNNETEEIIEAKKQKKSLPEPQKPKISTPSAKLRNSRSKKTGKESHSVNKSLDEQLPVNEETTTSEQAPIKTPNFTEDENKNSKIKDEEVSESGSEYVPSDEDSGKNIILYFINQVIQRINRNDFSTDYEKEKSGPSRKKQVKNKKSVQKSWYNFSHIIENNENNLLYSIEHQF